MLTPQTPSTLESPNTLHYYNNDLSKSQFNLIHINASINLLKLIYKDVNESKLRFFIIEILRRSRLLIQMVQVCCYYLFRVISKPSLDTSLPECPRKLFLGMLILLSKFTHDYNYLFKTWLKICGCNNDEGLSTLDIQSLRQTEMQCLSLLDHALHINGAKYENWCNVLLIFGYDFIALHEVQRGDISWCDVHEAAGKLTRWKSFFGRMSDAKLKTVRVDFKQYYASQIGRKVLTTAPLSLFCKRGVEDEEKIFKRLCK